MGLAVETVKPEWRDPEYGHRLTQIRELQHAYPSRPLVIAIGSSRTQMGLSPADMGFVDEPGSPLVYNFGQAGAGVLRVLLTLLRLLDDGVRPDFVLIEWFPAALPANGPAEEQAQAWAARLGAADLRRLEPYCDHPSRLTRQWASNRIAPWSTYRLTLMSHWQPGWLRWQDRLTYQWDQLDPFGWMAYPLDTVTGPIREAGIRSVQKQIEPQIVHFQVVRMSDRVVRDIIQRCRTERIPIAFYATPESPTVRGWYRPEVRATLDAYAATLTQECGVPMFDSGDGFAEDEFADGHHLLRAGAVRFSRRLTEEHLREWLQKR